MFAENRSGGILSDEAIFSIGQMPCSHMDETGYSLRVRKGSYLLPHELQST